MRYDYHMDLDLTGTKKEIADLIALVKGCPAYTNIRISSYDRLSMNIYSCRIEFDFDETVPGGKESPDVFAKYQRALQRDKGGYAGGRAPYGYKAENGTYIINHDEADIVRKIFAMRENHHSLNNIANTLNDEHIPSATGRKWRYTAIQSILNSRNTYLGYYHYGKNTPWVKGTHEPILDKNLYKPDFQKNGFKNKDDSSRITRINNRQKNS